MTPPPSLQWWFRTDAGLAARVAIGLSIFALLAAIDLVRHGAGPSWREYAFLLFTTLAGMVYGIANDVATSSISWEYYFYGKGLAEVMPAETPPDARELRVEAMKIGIKAGGSAGIVIGAMLLIANNPRRGRCRLTYRQLTSHAAMIFAVTIICSLLLARPARWVGCCGPAATSPNCGAQETCDPGVSWPSTEFISASTSAGRSE